MKPPWSKYVDVGRESRRERCVTARGDHRLEEALRDLTAALSATGAPWMVIGGIAVIARGVRRFTADIDAAIRGDEVSIDKLLAVLAQKSIAPRIDDAAQFARENLVLLLRHQPSGVEFDVSLAWTEFEHEAIAAATVAAFGAVKAPMARPEDLVVFKAIAGRGKDMDDVAALLALYPKLDLARVRARVRELAALADTPELARGLDSAIESAGARIASKPAKTSTPRKRPARKARPRATTKAATKKPTRKTKR
jgi:hypothetical protein